MCADVISNPSGIVEKLPSLYVVKWDMYVWWDENSTTIVEKDEMITRAVSRYRSRPFTRLIGKISKISFAKSIVCYLPRGICRNWDRNGGGGSVPANLPTSLGKRSTHTDRATGLGFRRYRIETYLKRQFQIFASPYVETAVVRAETFEKLLVDGEQSAGHRRRPYRFGGAFVTFFLSFRYHVPVELQTAEK